MNTVIETKDLRATVFQGRGTFFLGYERASAGIGAKRRYLPIQTAEEAPAALAALQAKEDQLREAMAVRRGKAATERSEARRAFIAALVPGMLLHGSWGYDQTNCELWELVEVKGGKAICKPATGERNATGHMSENIFPRRGAYTGDKREAFSILAHGVKLKDNCTLTPASWDRGYYSSWYA